MISKQELQTIRVKQMCNSSFFMRTLVLGIDGFSPDLVHNWIDDLPNLKEMMNAGTSGRMTTTIPPMSPAAWTTISTGLLPEQHGILGFLEIGADTYERKLARSPRRNHVWNLLSRNGCKSVVVNSLLTYPPSEIDGVMVSGLLTPNENASFVYPSSFKEMVLGEGYRISVDFESAAYQDYLDCAMARVRATKKLMSNLKWDLCWLVITEMDQLQHFHFHERTKIRRFYVAIDRIIGDFRSILEDGDHFLIISDHGFVKVKNQFSLFGWLEVNGYLKLRHGVGRSISAIDWPNTSAFPTEFGSIFFNIKGKYPNGIVSPEDVNSLTGEIIDGLSEISLNGEPLILDSKVKRDVYDLTAPFAPAMPDLLPIYNTCWRIVEPSIEKTLAPGEVIIHNKPRWTGEHSMTYPPDSIAAVFVAEGPRFSGKGSVKIRVQDIVPTILRLNEMDIPDILRGESLVK
jgi:predicted AlkP superfamily phosphohydrolase/phosphomutase